MRGAQTCAIAARLASGVAGFVTEPQPPPFGILYERAILTRFPVVEIFRKFDERPRLRIDAAVTRDISKMHRDVIFDDRAVQKNELQLPHHFVRKKNET